MIAAIVPFLSDSDALAGLLADVPPSLELIIADGGNDASLDALSAERAGVKVVRTAPGRGRQMNAGAALAEADWLFFLHADSRLPPGWQGAIESADPGIGGGWFRFALDDAAWQARFIEWLVAWRVRM